MVAKSENNGHLLYMFCVLLHLATYDTTAAYIIRITFFLKGVMRSL